MVVCAGFLGRFRFFPYLGQGDKAVMPGAEIALTNKMDRAITTFVRSEKSMSTASQEVNIAPEILEWGPTGSNYGAKTLK